MPTSWPNKAYSYNIAYSVGSFPYFLLHEGNTNAYRPRID
jgi:hypothetical protein